MKEKLTKEQTDKLKELGCEFNEEYPFVTLGDMLSMLPTMGIGIGLFIILNTGTLWNVSYNWDYTFSDKEMIDACFKAYVKLKKDGLC